MEKREPSITYTVVNPNRDCDFKKALKQAIIEKLLLTYKNDPNNLN